MDNKDFFYKLFGLKKVFKLVKDNAKATNKPSLKKDKTVSENARIAGNELYSQENHDENIHDETLIQYTKSIAFAPPDSEELALGYGNRSALLMHLHRYKDCLIDIDRALEITKSDQLKAKLQSRKERCLSAKNNPTDKSVEELLKKLDIDNRQVAELSATVSTKIPCAVECISVGNNKTYKRQLTATRDIKPGEIVIIEKAYACSASDTQLYLICSHCLNFAWSGIPCDFCVNSMYCSETCKKEAWEEYHDNECSILPSILSFLDFGNNGESNSKDSRVIRLLARIFIKAVKAEGFESIMKETDLIDNGTLDPFSNGAFTSNKFGYIYSLRCNPQKRIKDFQKCTTEAMVLYLLIKRTNLIPVPNKLKRFNSNDEKIVIRLRDIFVKLKSIVELNVIKYQGCKYNHANSFTCQEKCISSKGAFLTPFCGIINHSCVPNLSKFPMPQPKMIVYTTKPIKKGKQLFFTFGPIFTESVAERKHYLKQEMSYSCRCQACKNHHLFKQLNKETGGPKYVKVRIEFNEIFGDETPLHRMGCFTNPTLNFSKWEASTRASLDQALKLIELYFKYFEYEQACIISLPLDIYINRAFCELYGDRCALKSQC